MTLHACERLSPIVVYGRPWCDLTLDEQEDLLAFDMLRCAEESPPPTKP